MKLNTKKAFTLVELIVVIIILAILGTIAFISLQGYSKTARDSKRISDISNIKTSLELFVIQAGKYPLPDNFEEVKYNTEVVWSQGYIGDNVVTNLSRNLNKKPTDPLFNREYIYSLAYSKKEYEVLSIYEGGISSNNLINNTYASNQYTPRIDGTYNQIFVKTISYLVPTPSIINSEVGSGGLTLTNDNIKSQIITGGDNFPKLNIPNTTQIIGELDINLYATGIITKDSTKTQKESVIMAIQNAYSGSILATQQPYITILNTTDAETLAEQLILNSTTASSITTNSNTQCDTGYGWNGTECELYICDTTDPLSNIEQSNGEYLLGGSKGDSTIAKAQLICISNYQTNDVLSSDYKLMADVTFAGVGEDWDIVGTSDSEGWKPIGEDTTPGTDGIYSGTSYSGNFDGNRKSISNLYINRTVDYQGIFGGANEAVISNMDLLNVDITGYNFVGGISGKNGTINDSYVSGNISGNFGIGGLSGQGVKIINSYASGNVSGNGNVGGLSGAWGLISNSYATNNVTSAGYYIGGLVGKYGTIDNSYYSGIVTGYSNVGGILGFIDTGTITKSYSLNNPTLPAVGNTGINDNINTCSVGYAGCEASDIEYKVDSIKDGWDDSIWDDLTADEPKLAWQGSNTDSDLAWGCTDNPLNGMVQDGSGNYKIGEDIKTTTATSQLAKEQLLCMSQNQTAGVLGADYILMTDIVFDSTEGNEDWDGDGFADGAGTEGWIPIGNYGVDTNLIFTGNFDGNDNTITDLYINRSMENSQGMFGNANGGIISNIGLINVDIKGYDSVGGLVGVYGTITNSYATGNVTGLNNVGGLVGWTGTVTNSYVVEGNVTSNGVAGVSGGNAGGLIGAYGTVINSYTTCNVQSNNMSAGGLVGVYGIITNSYATGNVSAYNSVGGLVGFNGTSENIINSYSTGNISGSFNVGAIVGYDDTPSITKSYALNNPTLEAIGNYGSNSIDYCSVGNGTCVPDTRNDNWDFITIWEEGANSDEPILRNVGGQ